jgi:hypothetical protein
LKPRNAARAIGKAARAVRLPANEGTGTVIARWLRTGAVIAVVSWYGGLTAVDAGWRLPAVLGVLAGGLAVAYAAAKWGIRIQVMARVRKHMRRARARVIAIRSGS